MAHIFSIAIYFDSPYCLGASPPTIDHIFPILHLVISLPITFYFNSISFRTSGLASNSLCSERSSGNKIKLARRESFLLCAGKLVDDVTTSRDAETVVNYVRWARRTKFTPRVEKVCTSLSLQYQPVRRPRSVKPG